MVAHAGRQAGHTGGLFSGWSRGLTGLVIAGSLELTNLSTEQLVGQTGQSYATNMGAMN